MFSSSTSLNDGAFGSTGPCTPWLTPTREAPPSPPLFPISPSGSVIASPLLHLEPGLLALRAHHRLRNQPQSLCRHRLRGLGGHHVRLVRPRRLHCIDLLPHRVHTRHGHIPSVRAALERVGAVRIPFQVERPLVLLDRREVHAELAPILARRRRIARREVHDPC